MASKVPSLIQHRIHTNGKILYIYIFIVAYILVKIDTQPDSSILRYIRVA